MDVLLVGPYFANAAHGAEVGVYDALVELGHSVGVWDPRTKEYFFKGVKVPIGQVSHIPADLVLCLGPGAHPDVLSHNLWKNLKCLKVLWDSEPIRLSNYRDKIISQKGQFGYYFTFDESEIPLYHDLGIWNVGFLAQAYNPKWYKPLDWMISKNADDFCFIGSVGGKWCNREHFLNRVAEYCKNNNKTLNVGTLFDAEKVNQYYNCHKVILNLGLYLGGPIEQLKSSGLQQRVFEIIGAGKVALTNEISAETNQLFKHGENILFYNAKNLNEILNTSLQPSVQKTITENVLKIRDQHTYKTRLSQMFDMLKM